MCKYADTDVQMIGIIGLYNYKASSAHLYIASHQIHLHICISAYLHIIKNPIFTAMNILILGSGGRESAFAWKLSQSPKCGQLFIAPGNAGTGRYGTNVNVQVNDFEGIKQLV